MWSALFFVKQVCLTYYVMVKCSKFEDRGRIERERGNKEQEIHNGCKSDVHKKETSTNVDRRL